MGFNRPLSIRLEKTLKSPTKIGWGAVNILNKQHILIRNAINLQPPFFRAVLSFKKKVGGKI